MAKYPTLDLDVPDYIADTLHLTYREHGIYQMLLMQLWMAPRQRFPNDDTWLARKFRLSVEEVQNELRPLIDEFCQCDGNWITQRRITREFAKAEDRSKKQSGRAKSGWENRKEKSRGNAGGGNVGSAKEEWNAGTNPLEENDNTESRGNAVAMPARARARTPDDRSSESVENKQEKLCLFTGTVSTPHTPQGANGHARVSKQEVDAAFDRFWAAYPRHETKAKTREKLELILKRHEATADQLASAAASYARRMAAEGRPRDKMPHPTTWLNQKRWEDEAEQREEHSQRWQQMSEEEREHYRELARQRAKEREH